MGKNKPLWVHRGVKEWRGTLTPKSQHYTTLCGKSARRIRARLLGTITCPRCVELEKPDGN